MVDLSAVEVGMRLKVVNDLRAIEDTVQRWVLMYSMVRLQGQTVTVTGKEHDDACDFDIVRVAETEDQPLYWEGVCFDYVIPPVALSEYIFQEDLR